MHPGPDYTKTIYNSLIHRSSLAPRFSHRGLLVNRNVFLPLTRRAPVVALCSGLSALIGIPPTAFKHDAQACSVFGDAPIARKANRGGVAADLSLVAWHAGVGFFPSGAAIVIDTKRNSLSLGVTTLIVDGRLLSLPSFLGYLQRVSHTPCSSPPRGKCSESASVPSWKSLGRK